MTSEQHERASYEQSVGDVTDFLMGIRSVQTLFVSANTLEVLTFCCDHIPVHAKSGWESLPALLKKCRNLETLGLSHTYTVKFRMLMGAYASFQGRFLLAYHQVHWFRERETELIKYFLETMPRLEQLIVYYDTFFDDDVIELSSELKRFPTKASPSCEIQPHIVIPPHRRVCFDFSFSPKNGGICLLTDQTLTSMARSYCGHGVESDCVRNWILNVLERGVSDLDLHFNLVGVSLPSEQVTGEAEDRIQKGYSHGYGRCVLPKLKTLYVNKVMLGEGDDCFEKVTSGCHVLEELVLINVYSDFWNRSVSSKTLKSLILSCCMEFDKNPDSVSFDTPNVVYLEYSDYVSGKYPKVNFNSLVEASIDLAMTSEQHELASYEHLVGDVTDFLMGIRSVQTLYISANTLEVLTFCCDHIPVFHNMTGLTIQSRKSGWESLPALLKKCPNLETLVFDGLSHTFTIKCMDVDGCLCKYSGEVPTGLSSSPVKVLKILKFGDAGLEKETDLIKHFLETMPQLEQLMIYYDTLFDDNVIELSSELKRFPTKASPSCEIQVIFGDPSS
ncbi:hypothetical protein HID58_028192 [Brassica napus]|uniref:FBD domain-containing protein n=1 Tax=Brassica napus TaxID=3708 RepID=A0ABQ7XIW0_BRANA|nr:hypothetical protein HID58_028192 [Brassica napus]